MIRSLPRDAWKPPTQCSLRCMSPPVPNSCDIVRLMSRDTHTTLQKSDDDNQWAITYQSLFPLIARVFAEVEAYLDEFWAAAGYNASSQLAR
jgi:hypothetical protein